jgi:Carboxylesterase family
VYYAGVPHGRDVDYLIGYPFYNETLGNITGIVPEQSDWTYVDRNVSDFMQDMWLNFTKYGYLYIEPAAPCLFQEFYGLFGCCITPM